MMIVMKKFPYSFDFCMSGNPSCMVFFFIIKKTTTKFFFLFVRSWLWSYGSWIYNYLCNQLPSPVTLWVRISPRRGVLGTIFCDKDCQCLATGRWFSPGTLVSSTNKTDRQDITEILLKVALNFITLTHFLSGQKIDLLYMYYVLRVTGVTLIF